MKSLSGLESSRHIFIARVNAGDQVPQRGVTMRGNFEPAVPESEPLERYIEALWEVVRPHVEYLKALKKRFKVALSKTLR